MEVDVNEFGDSPAVQGSGLTDVLDARMGRDTGTYYTEYGPRSDSGAMVLHVYASRDHYTRLLDKEQTLVRNEWHTLPNMKEALEAGIRAAFREEDVTRAEYIPEVQSYYLEVAGLGLSLDPAPILVDFFSAVDEALA